MSAHSRVSCPCAQALCPILASGAMPSLSKLLLGDNKLTKLGHTIIGGMKLMRKDVEVCTEVQGF